MTRENNQREIIVRLFQVSNSLQTYLDGLLKPDHLTSKQFYMMIFIGAFDYDPRIGELSDVFGTSRQNVKQIIIKLEKQGYVNTYKDEHDSRIQRVRMTAQANQYWMTRTERDDRIIEDMFGTLGDHDLDVMRQGLMKLLEQLEILRSKD
jgi:DNA-binding MarR family transcriptional regulator